VDGVLLAVAVVLSLVARSLPEARADKVGGAFRHTVLAPILALQERSERARRALAAHDSSTLSADTAVLRVLDAGRLTGENDRLRALIGLGARLRDGFVAAEALHGPALGEEHTMVLNQGTRAGVQPFSPVIAPEGVVGYVRSADANTSVAIVWPHPDFRVSAMAADGSAFGIVSAHLGSGASRFLLEWRGVPFRTPMKRGTLVISSGVGGTFPRGIPIGTVMSELTSAQGWERTYLVLPAVHPANAGTVLVLISGRTRPDVKNVWATPDSAAAAVKRVITAADSLKKGSPPRDSANRPPP
jgi:rod shape-determining protein MreC